MSGFREEPDEENPGTKFVLSTTIFILKPCSVWLHWQWFMVPLGAPVLTIWHAAGVYYLVRFFISQRLRKGDLYDYSVQEYAALALAWAISIAIGYALSWGVAA